MKKTHTVLGLSAFELGLWFCSLTAIAVSFLCAVPRDYLTLIASLIGVTALIFTAKGRVLGQVLIVLFAVFYGIVSFGLRYYGEMITYLGMSAPMALFAIVAWLRHPAKGAREVEVRAIRPRELTILLALTAAVTAAFYFILRALGNANLAVSTLSMATSFFAAALTFLRSPFYALGYAANDLVLIALWLAATASDLSYLPMTVCFVVFLVNDLYGFVSWRRMEKRQRTVPCSCKNERQR